MAVKPTATARAAPTEWRQFLRTLRRAMRRRTVMAFPGSGGDSGEEARDGARHASVDGEPGRSEGEREVRGRGDCADPHARDDLKPHRPRHSDRLHAEV